MWTSPAGAILRRVADGDREALGELYDRYSPVVNGTARRILRDSSEAEDVVQIVFLQAWRRAERYDAERGTVAAWLCTLARTRALDRLRTRQCRRESSQEVVPESSSSPSTVEHLAVHQALDILPRQERETLELAYYEGLTQVEIAARLGQPLGTVKTRVRAALKRLRSTLGGSRTPEARGHASDSATVPFVSTRGLAAQGPLDACPRG
jgi:RNA polymerase sigma-70 factor, ECF subfamily